MISKTRHVGYMCSARRQSSHMLCQQARLASNFFLQGPALLFCTSISVDFIKHCQFVTKMKARAGTFLTESILISAWISAAARVGRFRCRSCPVLDELPFNRNRPACIVSLAIAEVWRWSHPNRVLNRRVVLRMINLMT
jgi:hypothetical protein